MITNIHQFKEQAEKNYLELRNVPSKYLNKEGIETLRFYIELVFNFPFVNTSAEMLEVMAEKELVQFKDLMVYRNAVKCLMYMEVFHNEQV